MNFEQINAIERSPAFAKKNYKMQTMIRQALVSKALSENEGFAKLSPRVKMATFQKLVDRPPVFRDQIAGSTYTKMGLAYQQSPVMVQTDEPSMSVFGKQVSMPGVVQKLTGYKGEEFSPIVQEVHGFIGQNAWAEEQTLLPFLGGALGKVTGIKELNNYFNDPHKRDDKRKAQEWFTQLAKTDPKKRALLGSTPAVGSIAGLLTDLGAYYLATGVGGPSRLIDGIAKKSLAKLGTGAAMKTAMIKAMPTFFRATGSGLTGVTRSIVDAITEPEDKQQAAYTEAVGNIGKTFGEYAMFDYAIGVVRHAAWPMAKLLGKSVGAGFLNKSIPEIEGFAKTWGYKSFKEFSEDADKFSRGVMDPVHFQALPKKTQDLLQFRKNVQVFAQDADMLDMDPFRKTTMVAHSLDVPVVQAGDKYKMWVIGKKGAKALEVDTIFDLNTALANYADIRLEKQLSKLGRSATPEVIANHKKAFYDSYQDIMNYKTLPNKMDEAYDPFLGIKKGSPEYTSEIRSLQKAVGDKKYLPVGKRTKIHPTEFDSLKSGTTGTQKAYKGLIIGDVLKQADEGTSAVILNKAATVEDVAKVTDSLSNVSKRVDFKSIASDDLVKNRLIELGFDGMELPDGNVRIFFANKIKTLDMNINPNTGMVTSGPIKNPKLTEAYIINKTTKSAKEMVKNPVELLHGTLKNSLGDVKPESVQKILEEFSGSKIKIITNAGLNTDGIVFVNKVDDGFVIKMPNKVTTYKASKRMLKDMFEKLTQNLPKDKQIKYLKQNIAKVLKPLRVPFADKTLTKAWVSDLISKNNKAFKVLGEGKIGYKNAVFNNIDDLAEKMIRETITPQQLQVELARNGLSYIRPGKVNKLHRIIDGKEIIASGNTYEELLENADYLANKVSGEYAPELILATKEGDSFILNGKQAYGNKRQLVKYLDSFENFQESASKTPVAVHSGNTMYKHMNSTFEVEIPQIGLRQTFDNPLEAKKFLLGEWQEMKNLKKTANRRMMDLDFHDGNWTLSGRDGNMYTAGTKDELFSYLKDNPIPSYADEIAGRNFNKEIRDILKSKHMPIDWDGMAIDKFDPAEFKKDINIFRKFGAKISPANDWILRTSKNTNHHGLGAMFKRAEELQRVARVDSNKGNHLIENIFRTRKGKYLSPARREGVYYFMTATDSVEELSRLSTKTGKSGWETAKKSVLRSKKSRKLSSASLQGMSDAQIKVATEFNLTTEEIEMANKARRMLGTDDTQGLFVKFGIDNDKFVRDYLPRLRKQFFQMKSQQIKDITSTELLQKTFGKDKFIPKEVKFWAENTRTSDLINFAQETDPMALLIKYNTQGHKKLYLGDIYDEINTYVAKNGKKMPSELVHKIGEYRDAVFGIATPSEKFFGDLSTSFFKAMGMSTPRALKAGHNIMNVMYGLNYMSTIGWRTYQPARNLMQVYTTLGSRFGNGYVNQAIQQVAENPGKIIAYLRELGIITEVPPIVNQVAATNSKFAKAVTYGLKGFGNSDEVTRAIAAQTMWNRFDEGLDKLKKGILTSTDDFMEYSAINLMDDPVIAEVGKLIKKGDIDSLGRARYLVGNTAAQETMFLYDRVNAPSMFKGAVGRVFGQYGTYSTGWRDNIIKGVTRGTKTQRAAYAARFIGNSAALYTGFNALGINATNFLPWTPAAFGGGPVFNLGVDALQSFGQGYQANGARQRLDEALSVIDMQALKNGKLEMQFPNSITPAYYAVRGIKRYIEYMDAGDPWKAYLSLTSAPIRQDWQ